MKGPVLLNLKGKQALVIGGGKVGLRRAETLAGYGCFVTCMDKKMVLPMPPVLGVHYINENFDPGKTSLKEVDLVVIATEKRILNAEIMAICRSHRIWCNVVDDPENSDFIFPSVVKRGDLTLSVCTDGASPFLTKKIKQELAEKYDESYTERLRLLKKLRRHVLTLALSAQEKKTKLKEYAVLTLEELCEEVEKI